MSSSMPVTPFALTIAGAVLAATMWVQPAFSREARFSRLTPDQLTEEQKAFCERFTKAAKAMERAAAGSTHTAAQGPCPGAGDPSNFAWNNVMLRSPVLAGRMLDLGVDYLNKQTTVPAKLNEFALLIVAAQWRADSPSAAPLFVWEVHAPKAIDAGLSPETLAAVKARKRPSNMAPDEALVYDFVTELTTKKKISDETFARAKKIFSDQQIVDLTVCAGNYVMVSMLQSVGEVVGPAGVSKVD